MARSKRFWIGGLIVLVLAAAALLSTMKHGSSDDAKEGVATGGANQVQVAVGAKAPDFTLQDLNGHTVQLSALKGKPVLLNFWASWCGPCRTEMPDLQAAYQAHQNQVALYGINLTDQDNEANARKFLQDNHITFPVLLDPKGTVNETYHIISAPTTIVIDKKGIILAIQPGQLSRKQMDHFMEQAAAAE